MARGASLEQLLDKHRQRLARQHRVRSAEQLVELVDALGFVFAFTGAEGLPVPALFDHLATSDTDRKWGWVWGWKDELGAAKRVYYGPALAKKPTFVSLAVLPVLYATFGRAGEIDDHVEDVRAGRVSDLGRRIVEFTSQRGESQSRRMRAELGITSGEGKREYDRALDDVQRLMYVTRVKAVGEGREEYNYTYDLFVRRYPEVVRAAERLSSAQARERILRQALELAGALSRRQALKLFDWSDADLDRAAAALERTGRAARREAILLLAEYAGAA